MCVHLCLYTQTCRYMNAHRHIYTHTLLHMYAALSFLGAWFLTVLCLSVECQGTIDFLQPPRELLSGQPTFGTLEKWFPFPNTKQQHVYLFRTWSLDSFLYHCYIPLQITTTVIETPSICYLFKTQTKLVLYASASVQTPNPNIISQRFSSFNKQEIPEYDWETSDHHHLGKMIGTTCFQVYTFKR